MAHKRNPGHGSTPRPQDLLEVPPSPQDRELTRDQVYKNHRRQQKEAMIEETGVEIGGVRTVKREGGVDVVFAETIQGLEDVEETVQDDGVVEAQKDEQVHEKKKKGGRQVSEEILGQSDDNVIVDGQIEQSTAPPQRRTIWERAVGLFNRVFHPSKK